MMLRGLLLVLQAALCDGLAFDPFSVQQDCLAASEVRIPRRLGLFAMNREISVRRTLHGGAESLPE